MTKTEEQVAFYMQVGCALTQWAHVEDWIRRIVVGMIIDDLNRRAFNVAFFALEGFRAKLDFAEAAVLRTLVAKRPEEKDAWVALVDRARRSSRQRNKLAHWRVKVYGDGRAGRRYALEDWVYTKAQMRRKGPKDGALCIRDVVKLRHEFYSLTCALENFLHRLAGKAEPFPKSAEQPSNPPTIQKLKRQIHEGFSFLPSGQIDVS